MTKTLMAPQELLGRVRALYKAQEMMARAARRQTEQGQSDQAAAADIQADAEALQIALAMVTVLTHPYCGGMMRNGQADALNPESARLFGDDRYMVTFWPLPEGMQMPAYRTGATPVEAVLAAYRDMPPVPAPHIDAPGPGTH